MGLYNCIGRKDMNVEIFLFGLIFLLPKGSICGCFFFSVSSFKNNPFVKIRSVHTLFYCWGFVPFSIKIYPRTLSTRAECFWHVWPRRRHVLNPSERDNRFNLFWNPLICLVLDYDSWLTPRKNKHACILVPIDVFMYQIFIYQMLLLIFKDPNVANL